ATRRLHAGVLNHLLGYLEGKLDGEAERALRQAIDAYRRAQVPLIVPLTLLRRHFRRHPHPEVEGQTYLEPSPRERMLREGI
ncbi:MAG: DUF1722 domain-containing protein, partial [SAR324 cluster bacterium]|nr:DUF1722 domain-containing protein [SAR324 cluster bacterium]